MQNNATYCLGMNICLKMTKKYIEVLNIKFKRMALSGKE